MNNYYKAYRIPKSIIKPEMAEHLSPAVSTNNKTHIKTKEMKALNLMVRCTLFLLLLAGNISVKAQGPYPNTGNHDVCLGATEPYGVVLNAGSTYNWTVTPLAGGNGTICS